MTPLWVFPGITAQHKAGLMAVSKLDTHEETCHPPPMPVLRRTGEMHVGLDHTDTAEGGLPGSGRSVREGSEQGYLAAVPEGRVQAEHL